MPGNEKATMWARNDGISGKDECLEQVAVLWLPSHGLIYFSVALEPWHFLFSMLATYIVSFHEKYDRAIILSCRRRVPFVRHSIVEIMMQLT